jgi:hypothetical protein
MLAEAVAMPDLPTPHHLDKVIEGMRPGKNRIRPSGWP